MTNEMTEFLKLNTDSNYYRLDVFAVLLVCQWPVDGVEIDGFETACQEIADHLASVYKIKSVWGHGSEQYDNGTEFEDNDGYYLFFEVPSNAEGERIELEVIKYFDTSYLMFVSDEDMIEFGY